MTSDDIGWFILGKYCELPFFSTKKLIKVFLYLDIEIYIYVYRNDSKGTRI